MSPAAARLEQPRGSARFPGMHKHFNGVKTAALFGLIWAVLLGMGNKLELWSEQAHHAQIRQTIGDGNISPQMMELRL